MIGELGLVADPDRWVRVAETQNGGWRIDCYWANATVHAECLVHSSAYLAHRSQAWCMVHYQQIWDTLGACSMHSVRSQHTAWVVGNSCTKCMVHNTGAWCILAHSDDTPWLCSVHGDDTSPRMHLVHIGTGSRWCWTIFSTQSVMLVHLVGALAQYVFNWVHTTCAIKNILY